MEQARAVLADFDPVLQPAAVTRLPGGGSDVYRIDVSGSAAPVVLKVYRDSPAWAPAKEATMARLLGDWAMLPTPTWLRVDESRRVLPLRYALTTLLPGDTVRALKAAPDIASLYREMGGWLKRLHGLTVDGYGYVLDSGVVRPSRTNAVYMAGAFETALQDFSVQGGDPVLLKRLERAAQRHLPLARYSSGPVFAHDDFQPGNLLAERQAGRLALTGLIDFGNARAADPLFDLAKALFCCAHEDPRSTKPLREGYGAIDHPDPQGALWLYTLYHRMVMWAWLTRLGVPASNGPADLLRDLDAMT